MKNIRLPTHKLERNLPKWAKIVKVINEIPIYNMSIFTNVMSWNQNNLDVIAIDYYGMTITYGELPENVRAYKAGFEMIGIKDRDVVTVCLPVSVENILSLFALNDLGAIVNSTNFLFLRNNFNLYTRDKKSNSLIILDAYLPFVVDCLENSSIDKVIITSLKDYLPKNHQYVFEDLSRFPKKLQEIFGNVEEIEKCIRKINNISSICFYRIADLIKKGSDSNIQLNNKPIDVERDSNYSYTSGTTTGMPKCIVYKELSANAFIELHKGINTKDYVGERVFLVIPLTHSTGERFSCILQLARGKTIVPQPIYNKDTFGEDLANSKCNWVTAAPSFYLAGVAKGKIGDNAFECVTRPSSGGEPVTKSNVKLIDKWLAMNGCKVRFSIGGGAAEDGSGTIFSYFMDEKTKTNETGHPISPGIKVKIVDCNNIVMPKGKRGFLHVSSAASADRYLNDEDSTKKRWYLDENGIKWGITGDIACENSDGSYSILGRDSDSYIDENGEKQYLFDIEYSLEEDDPVVEWEITAHKTKNKVFIVGQVVLKKEFKGKETKVIENLCRKYDLDAIKIYNKFESSEVTGKRDFVKLKNDRENYYAPKDEKHFYLYSFPLEKEVEKRIVDKLSIKYDFD